MTTSAVVLGPMIRYADETPASIWVETRPAALVLVRAGGRDWTARTFAASLKMSSGGDVPWPDLVAFLGDQVCADLTSEQLQEFIRSRRDIRAPPGEELKDFEEHEPVVADRRGRRRRPPASRAEGCLLRHDRSAAQRARG